MIDEIRKTRDYLDYLENHYTNVQKSWKLLQEKCKDLRFISDDFVWGSLEVAIQAHDTSKLSTEEFTAYRVRFFPTKSEKSDKARFGLAWEHHKRSNPHHWQNWAVGHYGNPYWQEVQCVHMVVDWMAMGLRFGDTAKSYYEKNKDDINIPKWSVSLLNEIFERLGR